MPRRSACRYKLPLSGQLAASAPPFRRTEGASRGRPNLGGAHSFPSSSTRFRGAEGRQRIREIREGLPQQGNPEWVEAHEARVHPFGGGRVQSPCQESRGDGSVASGPSPSPPMMASVSVMTFRWGRRIELPVRPSVAQDPLQIQAGAPDRIVAVPGGLPGCRRLPSIARRGQRGPRRRRAPCASSRRAGDWRRPAGLRPAA